MSKTDSAVAAQYDLKESDYFEGVRSEMFEFIPADARKILDIGCSGGGFGELLKQRRGDIEVWGVEIYPPAAAKAAGRLDHVINDSFRLGLPGLEGEEFDCITFLDVLEHMVNPEEALVAAKEYLAPGGTVVASIPNVLHFYNIRDILVNQDWKYTDAGIMDRTHLRFYTKKSIKRMFIECGFNTIEIFGINPSYGLKFTFFNILTAGAIEDFRYIQFAVRAGL